MSNVRLGRLVRVVSAGAVPIKGEVAGEPAPGLYPGFSASGQDVWLPKDRAPFREVGLVLSAVGARCGRVFLSPEGTWGVVANTAVLLPTSWAEPRFLYYLLNQSNFWATGGGAQPYVQLDASMSRHVPLLTFEEQRRIADFLDDRVARIDKIITARRQQTALIDAWHTTALQQLQDDLVARHGETRLGRLLSGLEQGWSPQADSTPASEDEWGVVRSGCVNDGVFRPQDNKRLPDDLEPRVQYEIRPGDLLMSRASGSLDKIGSVAVVPSGVRDRLLLCDKIYRLSASGGWLVEFLAPMMRTQKNRELIRLGVSGAEGMANNLPSGIVRSLLIPYAPAADQERTARTAAQLAGQREGLKHTHSVSIGLLTEYKQSLITAAVSGELDVSTAGSGIPG